VKSIKTEYVPKVLETVEQVASDLKPFAIRIDGFGIWPTVIYGEVRKGADEIRELHMKLVKELGEKVAQSKYDGESMHPPRQHCALCDAGCRTSLENGKEYGQPIHGRGHSR